VALSNPARQSHNPPHPTAMLTHCALTGRVPVRVSRPSLRSGLAGHAHQRAPPHLANRSMTRSLRKFTTPGWRILLRKFQGESPALPVSDECSDTSRNRGAQGHGESEALAVVRETYVSRDERWTESNEPASGQAREQMTRLCVSNHNRKSLIFEDGDEADTI